MRRIVGTALAAALALVLLGGCAAQPAAIVRTKTRADTTSTAMAVPISGAATGSVAPAAPRPIPNVVGKSKSVATTLLEAAGFRVKSRSAASAAKKGTVATQSPASSKRAHVGATVAITVSTGPAAPTDAEILRAFAVRNSQDPSVKKRRVLWKGRDHRGVWWAVVSLYDGLDQYAICGYRTKPGAWVVQNIGQPDDSVMVSSSAPPMPPAEVVSAMERNGVGVMRP